MPQVMCRCRCQAARSPWRSPWSQCRSCCSCCHPRASCCNSGCDGQFLGVPSGTILEVPTRLIRNPGVVAYMLLQDMRGVGHDNLLYTDYTLYIHVTTISTHISWCCTPLILMAHLVSSYLCGTQTWTIATSLCYSAFSRYVSGLPPGAQPCGWHHLLYQRLWEGRALSWSRCLAMILEAEEWCMNGPIGLWSMWIECIRIHRAPSHGQICGGGSWPPCSFIGTYWHIHLPLVCSA